MPTNRMTAALCGAALLTLPAFSAMADDREPTTEERTRIEAALRDGGYTSWEEIELDDGRWEVDDARHTDGHEYDLKLDMEYQIVDRDRDD